jgi:hypothetical protein
VTTPGRNTEWTILIPGTKVEGRKAVIQAANGPLQGWYLTVETETKEATEHVSGKRASPRIALAKDPARKLLVQRIFDHR